MEKLILVSDNTEQEKVAKREFDFPAAQIAPQITESIDKKGVKTSKVSSGSFSLGKKATEVLDLGTGDTITIGESEKGLFVYKSTTSGVDPRSKKKLTKTGILRITGKNVERIYTGYGLNTSENWFFKLEEALIDFSWEENAKVYVFTPFEKRA